MARSLKEIIEKAESENKKAPYRRVIPTSNWDMDSMMRLVKAYGTRVCPGFVIDDSNRNLYEQMIYWTMGDPDGRMKAKNPFTGELTRGDINKGFYIGGKTGRGKSVALKVLRRLYDMNPLVMADPVVGEITVGNRWVEMRADDITDEFSKEGNITQLKNEKLLCIQDLGSEPTESVYMGNRANVLRSLLEHRGDIRCLTFISSNIPMGHEYLKKQYGDRVQSRLCEMCNYLELDGEDRRK